MKQELIKYAEGMNCRNEIITWLERCVDDTKDQSEVEHIIDYLVSDSAPDRLDRATYEQMQNNAEKWTKTLEKKGSKIKEKKSDTEVILDFKDGFKVVKLVGENAYKREGFLMRHCAASYYSKDDEIYSLRDKQNMPHATMSKSSQQIKGKGNGSIHPKYVGYVVQFLEHLGIEVRDSEMQNLGYVNIEGIDDKNAVYPESSLFRKKYFLKDDVEKIIDKDGNKYENITLWKIFNIFDFNSELKVEFNFSISNCIETFKKYLNNKEDVVGYYAQQAGGDYAQQAGGDYAQQAGGNSAQQAGGYYARQEAGKNSIMVAGCNSEQNLLGKNCLALAGKGSKTKGVLGAWIIFAEYDNDDNIIDIHHTKIDGEKIKEDLWYALKNGKIVEVR